MKHFIVAFSAALMAFASPAAAGSFEADYEIAELPTIGAINVTVAGDLINDRPSSFHFRNGSKPWPVSTDEAEMLSDKLARKIEERLAESELYAPQTGAPVGVLNVEITRVRPSDITFTDAVRSRPGRVTGVATGGADMTATLLDASGKVVATYEYDWFERQIDQFSQGRGAWGDAKRAFGFFANRLAKELEEKSAASGEIL